MEMIVDLHLCFVVLHVYKQGRAFYPRNVCLIFDSRPWLLRMHERTDDNTRSSQNLVLRKEYIN